MDGNERKRTESEARMLWNEIKKVLAVPFADCDFDTGTFAESWSVRV